MSSLKSRFPTVGALALLGLAALAVGAPPPSVRIVAAAEAAAASKLGRPSAFRTIVVRYDVLGRKGRPRGGEGPGPRTRDVLGRSGNPR